MKTHLKIALSFIALLLCIALVCMPAGCKQNGTADQEQEEEQEEELTGEQEEEEEKDDNGSETPPETE
ncbi:MAG: hypothetical protein JSV77_09175, partial [Dehalococcoidales bacterium]